MVIRQITQAIFDELELELLAKVGALYAELEVDYEAELSPILDQLQAFFEEYTNFEWGEV